MKKISTFIVIFLVPLFSVAASFECKVNMQNVLLYKSGAVNVRHSGRSDFTYICNLNSEWKGVSVTTCAMWASMLINLHEDNKPATFYYTVTNDYDSCATLPTYGSSPAPTYVGTTN